MAIFQYEQSCFKDLLGLSHLFPRTPATGARGRWTCLRSHSCEVEAEPELSVCSLILEHMLGSTLQYSLEPGTARLSSS